MKNYFGKEAVLKTLPIEKTILAQSVKTHTQLLDVGEGFDGRYEVVAKGVLVCCTNDYTKARSYYFSESGRISGEQAKEFAAKLKEGQKAGLGWYLARDYAMGVYTLEAALIEFSKPKGIPLNELPSEQKQAALMAMDPDADDIPDYLKPFNGDEEAYLRSLPGYSDGF